LGFCLKQKQGKNCQADDVFFHNIEFN